MPRHRGLSFATMTDAGREISLLFDVFVLTNRIQRLIETALADAPLRGDQYAVYSLLFEAGPMTATEMALNLGVPLTTMLDHLRVMDARGHIRREAHPRDGRARNVSLTIEGVADHRRTNAAWEPMRSRIEQSLAIPVEQARQALRALDDAVQAAAGAAPPSRKSDVAV